jgi:hypothetical protein
MSADRWSECLVCKKKAVLEHVEKLRVAQESYGKIPASEYADKMMALSMPKKFEETLRQDWHLGIDDTGLFEIGYYAHCQKCGFKYKFEAKEDAMTKGKP